MRKFEVRSAYNLHDVLFLNGILSWYLGPLIEKELSKKQIASLDWWPIRNARISISESVEPKLKYFVYEGEPIIDYVDYLGLID